MKKIERIILTSKPVSAVRSKSKRIVIPGFHGLPLYDVYKFFVTQIQKEGLSVRAAAISFNVFLAVPATCIFLFTLLPYLPVAKTLHLEMLRIIEDISPNKDTKDVIKEFINDFFHKKQSGLLSIGFVLALFYSSNAMMGIIRTFDRSLFHKAETNFIEKRLRAIKLTLIMILLILATALVSAGQGVLFNNIMDWLNITNATTKALIQNLRWLVIIFLFLFSIAFIYKYAPSVHKRWQLFTPGALLATFMMIIATYLFSVWATNFSTYDKFYGSIGALLMIMMLIFINSLVLLIGYELNVSIKHLNKLAEERKKLESNDV